MELEVGTRLIIMNIEDVREEYRGQNNKGEMII